MKRSLAMMVLMAGVSAAGMQVAANGARQDAPPQTGDAPALELFDHMLEIKATVRDLARAAADPAKKEDALALVAALQKHIVAAKSMAPPGAEVKPEVERPAFVLAFRKAMTELLREVADLELDIIEDRHQEAVQRITTTIIEMRDRAHETFQIE